MRPADQFGGRSVNQLTIMKKLLSHQVTHLLIATLVFVAIFVLSAIIVKHAPGNSLAD